MTTPLLSVSNLSVAFRQGGKETLAVDRVSFVVNARRNGRAGRQIGVGQIRHSALGSQASALSARVAPVG